MLRLPDRPKNWLLLQESEWRARSGEAVAAFPGDALVPVKQLEAAYRDALSLLIDRRGRESLGDYLEFGVYGGASLGCMYRATSDLGSHQTRLFGFDSFEGLPTSEDEWEAGEFAMDEARARENLDRQGVDLSRVTLVKGWYDDTLTPEFLTKEKVEKASVIMLDCDVYSSTKRALRFSEPLIRDDAVLFFDDWWPDSLGARNKGEKRAFEEFLRAHPEFQVEELDSYYPKAAKVFLVTRAEAGVR